MIWEKGVRGAPKTALRKNQPPSDAATRKERPASFSSPSPTAAAACATTDWRGCDDSARMRNAAGLVAQLPADDMPSSQRADVTTPVARLATATRGTTACLTSAERWCLAEVLELETLTPAPAIAGLPVMDIIITISYQ